MRTAIRVGHQRPALALVVRNEYADSRVATDVGGIVRRPRTHVDRRRIRPRIQSKRTNGDALGLVAERQEARARAASIGWLRQAAPGTDHVHHVSARILCEPY